MTTGVLATPPILQFLDSRGNPLVGGSVLTQVGGVDAATYQDSALTTALPNPIPLNSRGEVSTAAGASSQLFLTPNQVYTFTVSDANGNQIWVATYMNGVQTSITQAIVGGALWPQTAAENSGGIVPGSFASPPTMAFRYGVDPTGTADSTAALQSWINAAWSMYNYVDQQGLWDGAGGAVPIATMPPGKIKVSGSTVIPSGATVTGQAHPANTVNHTRVVLNSTGNTPAAGWSANASIISDQLIAPGNGFYYQANNSAVWIAGVTGAAEPAFPTVAGQTVVDGTVTWTCQGATAAGDNRNTPMFKLSRATKLGGATLQNQYWTGTFEDMEFWCVNNGNDFANPLGAGGGVQFGGYPLGGMIYIDCDTADARIVSCCFQNSPCGIRIQNVKNGTSGSDGFANQGQVVLYVEECEFDAAGSHIYANNSAGLQLWFKNCSFFDGIHKYVGCAGRVVYENCKFFGGAFVDASDSGNQFELFMINGGSVDHFNGADTVSVYGATMLEVKNVTFGGGATPYSSLVANLCSSGQISGNSINDSGYNTTFSVGGLTAAAAIKMIDCQNMAVHGNNISATDTVGATYGGFGILTLGSVRGSKGNFIHGNAVSAPYNGAVYNGQTRSINLANTADILGVNYDQNNGVVPVTNAIARNTIAVPYGASMAFDVSAGSEFDITVTNANAFTIEAPTNQTQWQEITLMLRNTSGGALGAITWNAVFKINGTALSPANGTSQSIKFRYDGVNWVELWRGAYNIPN